MYAYFTHILNHSHEVNDLPSRRICIQNGIFVKCLHIYRFILYLSKFLGCMRYNSYTFIKYFMKLKIFTVYFFLNRVLKVFSIFSCIETPETGLLKNHPLFQFPSLFISDNTIIIAKQNILLQD